MFSQAETTLHHSISKTKTSKEDRVYINLTLQTAISRNRKDQNIQDMLTNNNKNNLDDKMKNRTEQATFITSSVLSS